MATAAKAIRTQADAVAWLAENGDYGHLSIKTKDEVSYVVTSAACGRCGGGGYGGWYPDGGICYDCRGANTRGRTRTVSIKKFAQKEKARVSAIERGREKVAAENEARHERMIEGQRTWCDKNGYGRITFEERDAARTVERDAKKAARGWVGEVKVREDFTATIKAIPTWAGYGYNTTTFCHIMEDAGGNIIVWKTTDNGFDCEGGWAEVGDTVTFKATVKEHGERDGEKQTIVTRAKVITVEKAKVAA